MDGAAEAPKRVSVLRPTSQRNLRGQLEKAREEVALMMGMAIQAQQHGYTALAITDLLWEATQPDEAPPFELSVRATA